MGVESVAFTAPRPAGPSANIAQWRREKGGKKMRRHFCKASYRVPAAPKRAAPAALPYGLKKRPETVPRCLLLKRPFLQWDHEPLCPRSVGEAGAGPALTDPQSGGHRTVGPRRSPSVRMEAKSCEAQARIAWSQRRGAGALPRRKLGQGALAPRVPSSGCVGTRLGLGAPSGFVSSGPFRDPPPPK